MSKRLQVLLPDQEMSEIQRAARRDHLTVGEWVRRTLREARAQKPVHDAETKLKAVRRGAQHAFPSADVEQMLGEIERLVTDAEVPQETLYRYTAIGEREAVGPARSRRTARCFQRATPSTSP